MPSFIYAFKNDIEGLKIGKGDKPHNRKASAKTWSRKAWTCVMIIEVPDDKIKFIDDNIKELLEDYNVKEGGGTEFFDLDTKELQMFKNMLLKFYPYCKERHDFDSRTGKIHTNINLMKMDKQNNNEIYKNILGEDNEIYKYIDENWNSCTLGRYALAFKQAAENGCIAFQKNLKLKPSYGRNDILKTNKLNLNDRENVNMWINEIEHVQRSTKNQYSTHKGNHIPNPTLGNGNLSALLKSHILQYHEQSKL